MLAMARLSTPLPSPDGTLVAFIRRDTDMEENRGRTTLWVVPIDGSTAAVQRSDFAEGASSPQWSNDGRYLYFLSARSGSVQVWRVGVSAGAPMPVSELPVSVGNLRLSPDGRTLAFSASIEPGCADLACTVSARAKRAELKQTGALYPRMFVRHWDAWNDGTRSQLLTFRLDDQGLAVDPHEATLVSAGLDGDVPSSPFGGREEITFTPDSQGLVFSARDSGGGGGEPWSTNFDLFHVSIEGGPLTKLTTNTAWDTQPVFSPDGKTLAYLAMERPGFEADRLRVVLASWSTEGDNTAARPGLDSDAHVLTQTWDRSVSEMHFSKDGSALFVTAQDLGQKPIFHVELRDSPKAPAGTVTALLPDGTHSGLGLTHDRLLFMRNDLGHPNELWTSDLSGADPTQLTHLNDKQVAAARSGDAHPFEFRGAKGDTVHGWIVEPVDFDPTKKYPVAFLIHGGPQGSFGNRFHFRWNPQTYAGAGYAVVMIDFHGSTGYGQDFTDAIRNDWGGKPLTDLKKGLAYAIKQYPWLDGQRVGALGASYGGYMVNWIAGNWADRFRCLVNHDGIFDQRMMYYATEELWFPEWEHRGPYFDQTRNYERYNPANHVKNWKTPMLVVHGSLDYRVPLEQGLATFTALQRQGVESRFLHFPDENHWVMAPANSIQWHEQVTAWLDAHLKP